MMLYIKGEFLQKILKSTTSENNLRKIPSNLRMKLFGPLLATIRPKLLILKIFKIFYQRYCGQFFTFQ